MSLIPDCRDMSKLLSAARDSGWPLGLRARWHLWICDVCRRVRAQFNVLGNAAGRSPENDGPSLSSGAKERLHRALRGS